MFVPADPPNVTGEESGRPTFYCGRTLQINKLKMNVRHHDIGIKFVMQKLIKKMMRNTFIGANRAA